MHHPKLRSMTPSVAFNFFRRLPSKVDMLLRSAIYISHSHVIIGARNTEVASEVKHSILQSTPSARINIIQIELSSLMSIRAFAEKFFAMDLPLNILINNVGVMYCPFQLLEDGIEMQFATNHVGHFLLTKLLLDKMKSTAERTGIESRIVNLSSEAHMTTYRRGIRFNKLNDKGLKTLWMLIVADVILWRKKNVTVGILIGVLTSCIIFEVAGYTLLSLVSNVLLLLISILFVWAKAAEVLNRYTVVGVLSQSQADNPF
ncbi:hypothetical protein ZIOFF_034529 [Zingiber officinale]|uniref:Reticulon-like protein n=1 Tax=Zingiber officinale TaxID=94328 RepID=A0A8J5L7W7_ZINOF|nr:hypothetical protein ZIOFF_034529 [Zingiber officinale]